MLTCKSAACQTVWCLRARRFFTFVFLLFLLHSMGIALFRLTGAICRDETIASTGGVRAPCLCLVHGVKPCGGRMRQSSHVRIKGRMWLKGGSRL